LLDGDVADDRAAFRDRPSTALALYLITLYLKIHGNGIDYLFKTQSPQSESRPPFIFFMCINNSRTNRIQ
jgi:hypothetical protein